MKSSVSYHSCAIKEFYIALPKAKKNGDKVWWKYAILKVGSRTKVVDGELLKMVAEIYNSLDTAREAIKHIMKVLKVNLSTAKRYIRIGIKLGLCKPKRLENKRAHRGWKRIRKRLKYRLV